MQVYVYMLIYEFININISYCAIGLHHIGNKIFEHHMGLGAAFHMSEVADPGEVIMKWFGVIEKVKPFPTALVAAGARGEITAELLAKELMTPWCGRGGKYGVVHISSFTSELARKIVWNSIPWIVRQNPSTYPFLLPLPFLDDLRADSPEQWSRVKTEDTISVKSATADQLAVPSSGSELVTTTGRPSWAPSNC